MNQFNGKNLIMFLIVLGLLACGSSELSNYDQVDRAGRPLLQLALIRDNERLIEWNEVTPNRDVGVLGEKIRTEIADNWESYAASAAASGYTPIPVEAVLEGFLPDVLRIDTAVTSGFNADSVTTENGYLMFTGGRLLSDDVGDIMLSYLLNSDATPGNSVTDNVSFSGAGGSSDLQGHSQTTTTFPFLAPPQ